MATEFKLTWRDEQGGRWRKRYKGKDYYFPRLKGETKATSYSRCYEEWQKKKEAVDQIAVRTNPSRLAWEAQIQKVAIMLEQIERVDTPSRRKAWSDWYAQISSYRYMIEERIPYPFFGDEEKTADPASLPHVLCGNDESEGAPPWEKTNPILVDDSKTLRGTVNQFVAKKRLESEKGRTSLGRFAVLQRDIEPFIIFAGATKPLGSVDSQKLSAYKDQLDKWIDSKTISPHTARDRLAVVKQFIRWAYELEMIELPRNLNSRSLSIAIPEQSVAVFADDEVKKLIAGASETTKLYLLLMLNTGMQQGDISNLLPSEVNWTKGRIIRKRSKTKSHDNVPEVSYPLWPETFRLLKKHGNRKGKHVLTNENGEALKVEKIVGNKIAKNDNIRSAFKRLAQKVKISKPMKLLRKTAATKLGEHKEYGRFAQYFLGHAPSNIADRHYVKPNEAQFDEAVKWLGTQWAV